MQKTLSAAELTARKSRQFSKKDAVNLTHFAACAVIFGSSWIAISHQVREMGYIWPVAFRFFIAGLFLTSIGYVKKQLATISGAGLFTIALLMFGGNFIFIYAAARFLNSGLNSLVCAMVIFFNCLSAGIFLRQPIGFLQIFSALTGTAGLAVVLSGSYIQTTLNQDLVFGTCLGLGGALVTSLGQVFYVRLRKTGSSLLAINGLGMITGSFLLGAWAFLQEGVPPVPESGSFYLSLFYLALVPTASGFLLYHALIDRVGPQKSAYVFVLAPAVAMLISSAAEGYQIGLAELAGYLLILLGFKTLQAAGSHETKKVHVSYNKTPGNLRGEKSDVSFAPKS